jgi:NADH-quinone oxidoreductase subunit J
MTLLLFAVLAAIAVVCGILMIVEQNPVRSALYLVLVMFSLAILYLTLNAAFIAAVQVVVYAGAVMVLFIFVIMLLNLGSPDGIPNRLRPQTPLGVFAGVILVGVLVSLLALAPAAAYPKNVALSPRLIGAGDIGLTLFNPANPWLFPFEVVSILLLVAAIGAVMLAKKRI